MTQNSSFENAFRVYRQLHRCSGWQARFSLNGVIYTKYFPDAAYGSSGAAKRAAEKFACENKELHKELLSLRRRFEVRANSRSGIPGVSRYSGEEARGPFWLAYWDDQQGRRKSRRYSIRRLGERKALELALKARDKGVDPFRQRYGEVLRILGLTAEPPQRGDARKRGP